MEISPSDPEDSFWKIGVLFMDGLEKNIINPDETRQNFRFYAFKTLLRVTIQRALGVDRMDGKPGQADRGGFSTLK